MKNKYSILCEKTKKTEPCEGCDRDCQYLYRVSGNRFITQETRLKIYKRDNYRCVQCGSTHPLSIDHIVSLYNGGSNEEDNLQTLCVPCNNKKADNERP